MAGNFALDMTHFINHAGTNVNTVTKKVVLDVMRAVIRKSPVDTGRFKGNWQYGVNDMPTGVTDIHDDSAHGQGGQGTLAHTKGLLPPQAAGKLHWIVNNLPYSIALEHGHSSQCPPNGMVGLTITEYQALVQQAVSEVNP